MRNPWRSWRWAVVVKRLSTSSWRWWTATGNTTIVVFASRWYVPCQQWISFKPSFNSNELSELHNSSPSFNEISTQSLFCQLSIRQCWHAQIRFDGAGSGVHPRMPLHASLVLGATWLHVGAWAVCHHQTIDYIFEWWSFCLWVRLKDGPKTSLPDSVMIQSSLMEFILRKRSGEREDSHIEEIIESPSPKEFVFETADADTDGNGVEAPKEPMVALAAAKEPNPRQEAIEMVTWFYFLPRRLSAVLCEPQLCTNAYLPCQGERGHQEQDAKPFLCADILGLRWRCHHGFFGWISPWKERFPLWHLLLCLLLLRPCTPWWITTAKDSRLRRIGPCKPWVTWLPLSTECQLCPSVDSWMSGDIFNISCCNLLHPCEKQLRGAAPAHLAIPISSCPKPRAREVGEDQMLVL